MPARHPRRLLWTALLSLALSPITQAAEWSQTWGAAPQPQWEPFGPSFPATPAFNNQTLRQVVRISAGGRKVRVRFSNEYGSKPLVIGAARIALTDEQGNIQAGTQRQLLFSGQGSVTIPAAAPFVSDPVDLPVKSLSSLSISLYVPGDTGPCTCHETGMQPALVSDTGDFTDKAFEPKETLRVRAFISGVEVESSRSIPTLVAFGDSITDGVGSTYNTNHRWPDLLADRLAQKGGHPWGVVNMGISGNRVSGDGAGQSALARFDRDALSVAGAKVVVVFEGVNDLGVSYGNVPGPIGDKFKAMAAASGQVTAASMIAAYRQLIIRAHARGLRILGATIIPYEGAMYYSPEGEAVRQQINQWIRAGREFDGVVDFDAVMRDPGHPTQIKDGFHAGDHLHGSDAGYAAMVAAFPLSLLR